MSQAGSGRQPILGWCSTWCVQYSVYAVLGVNPWSRDWKIECNDLTLCSYVKGELRTTSSEMGECNMGNCNVREFHVQVNITIRNMAGTSPHTVRNNTYTRSSKPNQASRSDDFSYPLVSSVWFLSSSPISRSCPPLYHPRRTQSWIIPLNLCRLLSWVNTKYSIHQVQHTPSTAYTKYSFQPALSVFSWLSWLWGDPWMYIIKMYFNQWEHPGGSERLWSVNLDMSILGEHQTLGGHSSRPSE